MTRFLGLVLICFFYQLVESCLARLTFMFLGGEDLLFLDQEDDEAPLYFLQS